MTVKELMNTLSEYDADMPVCIHGYEGGYEDLVSIRAANLVLGVNHEWYYGQHEEEGSYMAETRGENSEVRRCLIIGG